MAWARTAASASAPCDAPQGLPRAWGCCGPARSSESALRCALASLAAHRARAFARAEAGASARSVAFAPGWVAVGRAPAEGSYALLLPLKTPSAAGPAASASALTFAFAAVGRAVCWAFASGLEEAFPVCGNFVNAA